MSWRKIFGLIMFGCTTTATQADVAYHLTDLGTLGGADSRALGINNAGDVVGWAYTGEDEITHAYKYSYGQGSIQDIHSSGYRSEARGISTNGSIVGMVVDSTRDLRATLWHNNLLTHITEPGVQGVANAINDGGVITGEVHFGGQESPAHAFIYSNGTMHDIGTLGGPMSSGLAINSAGNIVGSSLTGSVSWQQHAFYYSAVDDTMHDLGTLGGEHSQANGINGAGHIVGWAWCADGHSEAFVYSLSEKTMRGLGSTVGGMNAFSSGANGVNENGEVVGWWSPDGFSRRAFVSFGDIDPTSGSMIDINTLIDPGLGWTLVEARAINDNGAIVGFGIDPSGIDRGFLLTPASVPCPGLATGFLCTMSALVSLSRSRHGH